MTHFFKKSQVVNVSRITKEGWWIENCQEHVAKGTALGEDFTQSIYTPSAKGMIAQYNRETKTWSDEIEDMTWKKFYSPTGQRFIIGEPEGAYPEWAVLDEPPEFNIDTETVLYRQDLGWKVYPIRIGELYYDEFGRDQVVADFNFELPENHSWNAPPNAEKGFAYKLIDGQWTKLEDHRGKWAYAKNNDETADYEISQLGAIPNTHTLEVPNQFDSWFTDKVGWQYDIERHRPVKIEEEKAWRNHELTKIMSRIDQYEKDQQYAVELRTSPIENNDQFLRLLQDRKALCDYPEAQDFPFSKRPNLSGVAN